MVFTYEILESKSTTPGTSLICEKKNSEIGDRYVPLTETPRRRRQLNLCTAVVQKPENPVR